MGGVILPVCRLVPLALAAVLTGCTQGPEPADRATPAPIAAVSDRGTPSATEPATDTPATETPAAATSAPATRGVTPAPSRAVAPTPSPTPATPSTPRQSPTATPRVVTSTPPPPVEPVRRFRSAAAVVAEIVAADRELAASGTTATRFAAAARRRRVAVRELVRTPSWRAPAIAGVRASSRAKLRADVAAGHELSLLNRPRPTLPNWRIIRPESPEQLLSHYRKAQGATGIHWSYLAAINLVETNMGRIRGLSSAGARGPMQFMPGTWAEVGRGDIDDPHDSIQAAARYLVRRGGLRSIARGLRGYNNSARYVTAVMLYAEQMRRDPKAFREYYEWPVMYPMTTGDVVLNVGFDRNVR